MTNLDAETVVAESRNEREGLDTQSLTTSLLSLLHHGDHFMLLGDFDAYVRCQDEVSRTYRDASVWTRKSTLNTAQMGKFSSDRTIREYARQIWGVRSVPVSL